MKTFAGSSPIYQADVCKIADWVTFGPGCVVHDFAVVGRLPSAHHALARVTKQPRWLNIGGSVEIGCHAILYAGSTIGNDVMIGDGASVREGCTIGDRCVVGRNVTVHYDVELGPDVHIIDGTHITGGAKIGRGTFIGVGVVMSNDKRREIVDYEFVGVTPPVIGCDVLIGSGACIIPGVTIGDGAVIGAGALVVKDVAAGETVLGAPAGRRATDAERQMAMLRSRAEAGLNSLGSAA